MKMRSWVLLLLVLPALVCTSVEAKDKDKEKSLPPGLQNNLERGKPLPPGWQKKLVKGDVLDDDVFARGKIVVPVGDHGLLSIEVEGTLIKLDAKTHVIVDFTL